MERLEPRTPWYSAGFNANAANYVVCTPTFRRPDHLRKTLSSLDAQEGYGPSADQIGYVVVDNDAQSQDGAASARAHLRNSHANAVVLTEPTGGNCACINRAFETARNLFPNAKAFLMIDDDEIADPNWLSDMITSFETTKAAIVGGPVLFDFEDPKSPYCNHPMFEPIYVKTGPVPIIYGSGNCLISRRVFEGLASADFDMRFNFLGGGDTDFFTRAKRAGYEFHWSNEAIIRETVPRERTSFTFLAKRALRTGALNYLIDSKGAETLRGRARVWVKNIGSIPLGLFRAAALFTKCWDVRIAVHPILTAAGRSLAAIGIEPHQYRA